MEFVRPEALYVVFCLDYVSEIKAEFNPHARTTYLCDTVNHSHGRGRAILFPRAPYSKAHKVLEAGLLCFVLIIFMSTLFLVHNKSI